LLWLCDCWQKAKIKIDRLKLYKYFSDNIYSYRSIAVRGLYCHYPKNMNDPFECLGYSERLITNEQINLFREKLDSSIKSNERFLNLNNQQLQQFLRNERNELIKIFAFSSLSENFDDILMWSHYSSGHTGFVLEFEFREEEISNNFQKINYVDKLPNFEYNKIADFLNGQDKNLDYLLSDISLKSKSWKSEKEWRIWRKKPTYYHYEKHNLKNVYFGINTPIETKAIIAKLVSEINNEALFHQMKFSDDPIRLTVE